MINTNKISKMMNKILVWVAVMMLSITSAFADELDDIPDAPDDVNPTAPIDGYVWVLALIGLVYIYLRIRAFTKQANSESK